MTMKNNANDVEFNFFGNVYYLKDKNDDIRTKEVVDFVQHAINEIHSQYGHLAPHKQIVLAFLKLGKECIISKKKLQTLEEVYSKETKKIAETIDKVIEETHT